MPSLTDIFVTDLDSWLCMMHEDCWSDADCSDLGATPCSDKLDWVRLNGLASIMDHEYIQDLPRENCWGCPTRDDSGTLRTGPGWQPEFIRPDFVPYRFRAVPRKRWWYGDESLCGSDCECYCGEPSDPSPIPVMPSHEVRVRMISQWIDEVMNMTCDDDVSLTRIDGIAPTPSTED